MNTKFKPTIIQKKFINLAKKTIMPDENYSFDYELGTFEIKCRQVAGYDLRIFIFVKDELKTMYTFYDNKGKWVEERHWAKECFFEQIELNKVQQ